jgi:hypothetical protein
MLYGSGEENGTISLPGKAIERIISPKEISFEFKGLI